MTNKVLSSLCAFIDGLITLVIFIIIAGIDGKTPAYLVNERAGLLLFVLVIAAIVMWRGYADAKRLLIDRRNWTRPSIEGFVFGFLVAPVSQGVGMLQEAFAAGPPWPSFGYSPLSDWLRYLFWLMILSVVLGVVAGICTTLLSLINRLIISIVGNKFNTAGCYRSG
jgi:hypothetical protein